MTELINFKQELKEIKKEEPIQNKIFQSYFS